MPAEAAPPPVAPPAVPPREWSDEVREIMVRPPHWVLRSGAGLLALGLLLLLALGWMISYPDVISGRLVMTGTHPAVDVVARQSGHLESLRVRQSDPVRKGDVLAVIRSPASADTVFGLKERLERLSPLLTREDQLVDAEFQPLAGLGRLEPAYSEFMSGYRDYRALVVNDHAQRTATLLQDQIVRKRSQLQTLEQQQTAMGRELELGREKYQRLQALHDRGAASTAQLQAEEQAWLSQQREFSTLEKNLLEEQITAASLEQQLVKVLHERSEALRLGRQRLRSALNKLNTEIELWEADHVLRAPADGRVAFYDFWSDQQYVTQGSQVFVVVPETSQLMGRMQIKHGGAGKIRPGQPVRIRFDDYPYKEFGLVTGRVNSVSLVAREGTLLVLVDVDYPMISSFRQRIEFKQNMTGEASIITEEMRLLGRIFYEVRRAFVQTR